MNAPQQIPDSNLHKLLTEFGTATMFLTRLPVGKWGSGDTAVMSAATRFYPLTGLLVGALLAMAYCFFILFLPIPIALVLTVIASVLITGGFHEDGLADVADSAGAFDLDRKLEIMRDSRVGTYGTLAVVLLIALKLATLWVLSAGAISTLCAALLAAHVLSRWSSLQLMSTQPYARAEAPNKAVASSMTPERWRDGSMIMLAALMPSLYVIGWPVLVAVFIAWLCSIAAGRLFQRWYRGITGDCLGAANQVVEVTVLVTLASL